MAREGASEPEIVMPNAAPEISTGIEQLRQGGWCILHDIIPVEAARQTRIDLYRVAATCGVIAQSYNPNLLEIPFYTRVSVIKDCQRFAPFLLDSRVKSIVDAALGPKICVTATTMQVHEFGTQAGPWHIGEPFDSTSTSLLRPDAIAHLTLVWMFSHFSKENGGYRLLPGSHLKSPPDAQDVSRHPEEVTVTGTLGSVLITDSRLWRAVAPNDDDLIRLSVTTGFAALPTAGPAPRDEKSVLAPAIFNKLPPLTQPLFEHWVQH
jgi:hypothetical protein